MICTAFGPNEAHSTGADAEWHDDLWLPDGADVEPVTCALLPTPCPLPVSAAEDDDADEWEQVHLVAGCPVISCLSSAMLAHILGLDET